MKNLIKTPFASALAGGLVVAVLGLVALATGLVDAGGDSTTTTTTVPATSPATALASDDSGKALSVNEIYTQDSPGVVYIEAQQQAQSAPFDPFGPSQGGTATGSGFVIDSDGHILTNAHVVEGSDEVTVRVGGEDGQTFDAKVVGADPSTDVAVLEVDSGSEQLQPLELGSSSGVEVGDPVVAIGNPFGLDRTATAGIVSAVQRQINAPNGFTIDERDPDRRADQPRQLGRSADRLRGPGDRDQLADRVRRPVERQRRHRLRRSDRHRPGDRPAADRPRRGRARVRRHQRRRPDAGDRRRAQPRREQRRSGPGRRPRQPRGRGRDRGGRRPGLGRRPADPRRR